MGRAQDARSDLFSLGVLLYEMLTGISPFAGESLQKVCNHVLSSRPLPPSQVNASIPKELDEILAKCLAKDPQQRMASAEMLAEQLYRSARYLRVFTRTRTTIGRRDLEEVLEG